MLCQRRVVRLALVLFCALALSTACAVRPPLTCPERGGPLWSELSSEHLILKTDADPASARRILAELEGLYEALTCLMRRPRQAPSAKVEVVMFDRVEDLAALVGPERSSAGFFAEKLDADFEPEPIVVFPDDPRVGRATVFVHELAHRLLRERIASPPPWLDEGLAQLYSTLRVERDRIVVGERRPAAYADFAELPLSETVAYESASARRAPMPVPLACAPSLARLLDAGPHDFHAPSTRAAFYAAAFRLAHLVSTFMPDRFAAFLDDLERGASAYNAFLARLGPDLGSLDAAYVEYLRQPRLPTTSVAHRALTPSSLVRGRAMHDANVHLLFARLRPWGARTEDAVVRDVDEALRAEPGSPEAHYMRARLDAEQGRDEDAARQLDAALAARPDEPRYLYARLAVRSAPLDDRTRALLDRLSRVATSAAEWSLVADAYGVELGRIHQGLVFAERALAADPICWRCEKVRSRILFRGGRYAEAVAAADRALALAPEGEPASGLRSERDFLARLRDTAAPLSVP
jgi:tetratricopeptide (TPR) repeat protein